VVYKVWSAGFFFDLDSWQSTHLYPTLSACSALLLSQ
jgi:hypothetical protein